MELRSLGEADEAVMGQEMNGRWKMEGEWCGCVEVCGVWCLVFDVRCSMIGGARSVGQGLSTGFH
jgi:hypothetical protein